MAENQPHTTLPVTTYRWRRWLSFGLLILCLSGLYKGLSSGCVKFSRVGVVDCLETNALGYWSSIIIIMIISIGLFFFFLSSFGQVSDEIHEQEDHKLTAWLESVGKHKQPLIQNARMPQTAFALLIVYTILVLWLLWQYNAFQDVFRLGAFAFLLIPFTLIVTMFSQWLGEKIEINQQGIKQFIIWRGWKLWKWQDLSLVRMEGDYFEKNYQISLNMAHQRLILKPATFHQDKQKFLSASHWILQEAVSHQVNIQLPPDGIEEWLEGITTRA